MIELIRESFMEAIRNATWMTSATRAIAEQKVFAMVRNVGYPEDILNQTYMDQTLDGVRTSWVLYYTIRKSNFNSTL